MSTTPPPAGFTPGEWSVPHFADRDCRCNCGYVLSEMYMGAVATVHYRGENGQCPSIADEYPDLKEASANARLIAAAPDLYAACKAMAGGYGAEEIAAILKRGCNGSVLSLAVHALAKAGGGA